MEYGIPGTGLIIGFVIFIGILFVLTTMWSSGFFDWVADKWHSIRERYARKVTEKDDIWDFNLTVMLLGGLGIFFVVINDLIKEWFDRNKWRILFTIVNIVMIVPITLLVTGVVQTLPEAYFPFFVFYLFIALVIVVSRSDDRRSGRSYHHQQESKNPYNAWTNPNPKKTTSSYTYKPKPRGLSQTAANRKKKQIREKLIENEELKNKYNLSIPVEEVSE